MAPVSGACVIGIIQQNTTLLNDPFLNRGRYVQVLSQVLHEMQSKLS